MPSGGRWRGMAIFPELGLSCYSCDDLFHQDALLEATLAALKSGC